MSYIVNICLHIHKTIQMKDYKSEMIHTSHNHENIVWIKHILFLINYIFILWISFFLQNSFADIARILSDFFRDLDVVPSDVVAGLVLLRQYQKFERETIVSQVLFDLIIYLFIKLYLNWSLNRPFIYCLFLQFY